MVSGADPTKSNIFRPPSISSSRTTSASTPESTLWRQLDVRSLSSILASRQGFESIVELEGEDAVAVVEILDLALDSPDLVSSQRKNCAVALRKLCGRYGILPTSHTLMDGLETTNRWPLAGGGFAEVWKGEYKGRLVAIKVLKMYAVDDPAKVKRRFCKETVIWKHLSHPNILPFLGVSTSPFPFCMVSIWMTHGDIVNYVKVHPEANRLLLLSDIANGLNYLHSENLVHGDLKGANILINNDYRACLADFGLMVILYDSFAAHPTSTAANGGTLRWMAPELLMPEKYGLAQCRLSKESDIYAVGMVIYEVMTGNVPFHRFGTIAVTQKVLTGNRPERPMDSAVTGLSDDLWQIIELCWHQQRTERPTIHLVLDHLNKTARYWEPPSPMTGSSGWDTNHSDDSSSISDSLFSAERHWTQMQMPNEDDTPAIIKPSPSEVLHVTADDPGVLPQDTPVSHASIRLTTTPPPDITQPPCVESSPSMTPELFSSKLERLRDRAKRPSGNLRNSHTEGSQEVMGDMGSHKNLMGQMTFSRRELLRLENEKRSSSLTERGTSLHDRFKRTHKLKDLEEAIAYFRTALELRPLEDSCRWYGGLEDLGEAIIFFREALDLRPLEDSGRWYSSHNLARAIEDRFKRTQKLEDLEEAIVFFRKTFELRPLDDADRWYSSHNIARTIEYRFKRTQKLEDLEELIICNRRTFDLRPPKDPKRWCSAHNIARTIECRFNLTQKLEDLEEAIIYYRKTLALRPLEDPDRRYSSQNLARVTGDYFKRTEKLQDLK